MSTGTGANEFYNDELIVFGRPEKVKNFLLDVESYAYQLFKFVPKKGNELWGKLNSTQTTGIDSFVVISVEVTPADGLGLDTEQRLPVWSMMRLPRKVNIAYFASWHVRPLTRKHRVLISLNPTATGNPYGVGGDPYGVGGDPYGVGGDPYGVGGDPYGVGGDPYGVGGDPYGVGGDPYGVGGDPYGVGGDPYGVGGDPYGVGGDPLTVLPVIRATQDEFLKQPAFNIIGLKNAAGSRVITTEGDGVRVGVFDTALRLAPGVKSLTTDVKQILLGNDFGTTVVPNKTPDFDPANNPFLDISDHSLSVISLINEVAPKARIELLGVLNDDGEGSLTDLIKALYWFVSDVLKEIADAPTAKKKSAGKAVINMSLGSLGLNLNENALMEKLFTLIEETGIVVVAAAGNETRRAFKSVKVLSSQMPGALPSVISVAGCTRELKRASFSNQGDVAAPSGNVVEYRPDELEGLEKPVTIPKDHDTVIGYSQNATPIDDTIYNYRRWKGTSFATPLVSGVAALVLSKLDDTAVASKDRAAVVRQAILQSAEMPPAAAAAPAEEAYQYAGLGQGIVNIQKAINALAVSVTAVSALRTEETSKKVARKQKSDAQKAARQAERQQIQVARD